MTINDKTLTRHLAYAKRRWTLLFLLAIAGLLAAWATSYPGNTARSVEVLERMQRFNSAWSASPETAESFSILLQESPVPSVQQAEYRLQQIGRELEKRGIDARTLSFFTLGPDFSNFASAFDALRESDYLSSPAEWDARTFRDIAALSKGFALSSSHERDITAAATLLDAVPRSSETDPLVSEAKETLEALQNGIATFQRLPAAIPADLVDTAHQIGNSLRELEFSGPAAALDMGYAERAIAELTDGSLSFLGFNIPGLTIKLLLPFVAFALALDLYLRLGMTRLIADRYLSLEQARRTVVQFPWLIAPIHSPGDSRPLPPILPAVVQLLPSTLLVPLVLTPSSSLSLKLVGLGFLVAAAALQIASLVRLHALTDAGQMRVISNHDVDADSDLLGDHLQGIATTWSVLGLATLAVCSFFLAFVAVPSQLLGPRDALEQARATRNDLGVVYDQRLLEHRDSFREWCQIGCAVWSNLTTASMRIPPGHAAADGIREILELNSFIEYSSSVSRMSDAVQESRPRFATLDIYDAKAAIELLYRERFDDIASALGSVAHAVASSPLDSEIMALLPDGAKTAPAPGVTPPFIVPYRTWVERGGFADGLVPLPPREQVDAFLTFVSDRQMQTLAAFDQYASAFERFDTAIGKMQLKIAGLDIPRGVVRDGAVLGITFLMSLLSIRLHLARRLLAARTNKRERSVLLLNAPSLLFHPPEQWPTWLHWGIDVACFAAPVLVLGIVLVSPGGTTLHESWLQACGAISLALAFWASYERHRLFR